MPMSSELILSLVKEGNVTRLAELFPTHESLLQWNDRADTLATTVSFDPVNSLWHMASIHGQLSVLEWILSLTTTTTTTNILTHCRKGDSLTSVHLAALHGHIHLLEYMLARTSLSHDVVLCAVRGGHVHVLKYLVEHCGGGLDIHLERSSQTSGETPAYVAAQNGHTRSLEYILNVQ